MTNSRAFRSRYQNFALCSAVAAALVLAAVSAHADSHVPVIPEYLETYGGPRPTALNNPIGVSVDAGGNVLVTDTLNHDVEIFDLSGNLIASYGVAGDGDGEFITPISVHATFTPAATVGTGTGTATVVDNNNNRLQQFTYAITKPVSSDTRVEFTHVSSSGSRGTSLGQFVLPSDLAVHPSGTYLGVTDSSRVQLFAPSGLPLASVGTLNINPGHDPNVGNPVDGDGELYLPGGLAISSGNRLYVSDTANHRVQVFQVTAGPPLSVSYLSQFGELGTGDGQFNRPLGIALDASGNVWVIDSLNHRVQVFDQDGAFLYKFGSRGVGDNGFFRPADIDLVGTSAYVTDQGNHRVQIFSVSASPLSVSYERTLGGAETHALGEFNNPLAVESLPDGRILVADSGNHRLQVLAADGTALSECGIPSPRAVAFTPAPVDGACGTQMGLPRGLEALPDGRIAVVDSVENRVLLFSSDLSAVEALSSTGSGGVELATPGGVSVAPDGRLYVADTNNHRVQVYSPSGQSYAPAQAFGNVGFSTGEFNSPNSVAVGPGPDSYRLYVADTGNSRIQAFDLDGRYLFSFGGFGSDPGSTNNPADLEVDANGRVHVVDSGNHRIQVFDHAGEFAFSYGSLGEGDGEFVIPAALAVAADGSVLVADSANHRVQKFGPGDTQRPRVASVTSASADGPHTVGDTLDVAVTFSDPVRASTTEGIPSIRMQTGGSAVYEAGSGTTTLTFLYHVEASDSAADLDYADARALDLHGGAIVDMSGNMADLTLPAPGSPGSLSDSKDLELVPVQVPGFLRELGDPHTTQGGQIGMADFRLKNPGGVAVVSVNGETRVFVSDTGSHQVDILAEDGTLVSTFGSFGLGPGEMRSPAGILADSRGRILLVDSGNHRVQVFGTDGSFQTALGGSGQFSRPTSVVEGPGGTFFAGTDSGNHRVLFVLPNGIVTRTIGGFGFADGQFNTPLGLAMDSDRLYVADTLNRRVQVFDLRGTHLFTLGAPFTGAFSIPFGGGSGTFVSPSAIAIQETATGSRVYVADAGNLQGVGSAVHVFDVTPTTLSPLGFAAAYRGSVGEFGDGDLEFNRPSALTLDAAGRLYVADSGNHRIQRILVTVTGSTASAVMEAAFGAGPVPGNDNFYHPLGVDLGSDGRVAVTDSNHDRVLVLRAGAQNLDQQAILHDLQLPTGQFDTPSDVAIDSNGRIIVAGNADHTVHVFEADGTHIDTFGTPTQLCFPRPGVICQAPPGGSFAFSHSVDTDSQNRMYVVDTGNNRVQVFGADGTYAYSFGSSGPAPGSFNQPHGIAISADDRIYVADTGNHRVQEFELSANGQVNERPVSLWGGSGSGAGRLSLPHGIATDALGRVHVADTDNHRIKVFDPDGRFAYHYGTPGVGAGQFAEPHGLAVDERGNTWVADSSNDRLVVFGAADFVPPRAVSVSSPDPDSILTAGLGIDVRVQFSERVSILDRTRPYIQMDTGSPDSHARYVSGDKTDTLVFRYVAGASDSSADLGYVGSNALVGSISDLSGNPAPAALPAPGSPNSLSGSKNIMVVPVAIPTLAGQIGGTSPVELNTPAGLEIVSTPAGKLLLVTDWHSHHVDVYSTATGTLIQSYADFGTEPGDLRHPSDVVYNSFDNTVLVVDSKNHRVNVYDLAGEYLGQIGSLGTESGQFSLPFSIAQDSEGRFIVSDAGNHRVQVYNADGIHLQVIGEPGVADGQFLRPVGVAVDALDRIYVADSGNHRIQVFDRHGVFLESYGTLGYVSLGLPNTDAVFAFPYGIDVQSQPDGSVLAYVADTGNSRVQVYRATFGDPPAVEHLRTLGGYGTGSSAPAGSLFFPMAVKADADGTVYVSDSLNHRVQVYDADGSYTTTFSEPARSPDDLNAPAGVATDSAGRILVSDKLNFRVQVFGSDGSYEGSVSSPAFQLLSASQFTQPLDRPGSPYGIAVGPADEIITVGEVDNMVHIFDKDGDQVLTFGGLGCTYLPTCPPVTDTTFGGPRHVAADSSGRIYVADTGNHRVQAFQISSEGGQYSYEYLRTFGTYGNGPGQLQYPHGVAVDENRGRLYVTDNSNHRVQAFGLEDGRHLFSFGDLAGSNPLISLIERISTLLGSGVSLEPDEGGQLSSPDGIAVDPQGRVHVADNENHRVHVFDANGRFVYYYGEPGSGTGQFNDPHDIAVHQDGRVLVLDSGNHRILAFTEPDVSQPSIVSVSSSPARATLNVGERVQIMVQFSERVGVSTERGVPYLELRTGGDSNARATYKSGSGSDSLVFEYVVRNVDSSRDLDYAGRDALSINGGSISDLAGNLVLAQLAEPGSSGSLSASSDLNVRPPQAAPSGGGGGGGRTGVSPSGGGGGGGSTFEGPTSDVHVGSVRWDCDAASMTALVGPDTGGIYVQFLDPDLGQSSAREDTSADAPTGYKAFTGNMSPSADFVQVTAIAVSGRAVSTDRVSVDIDSCTGSQTFRESVEVPEPALATGDPASETDIELPAESASEAESVTPEPAAREPETEPAVTTEPALVAEPPMVEEPSALECAPGTELSADGSQCIAVNADSGCLIATAAYGTELAWQVQTLREIRDGTLYSTESGSQFMSAFNHAYYSFSPAVADLEREHPEIRSAVRALLTPMLASLGIMSLADPGSENEVLAYGISVIALNLGMYVAAPVAVVAWAATRRRT